jgi:hypothetical protein
MVLISAVTPWPIAILGADPDQMRAEQIRDPQRRIQGDGRAPVGLYMSHDRLDGHRRPPPHAYRGRLAACRSGALILIKERQPRPRGSAPFDLAQRRACGGQRLAARAFSGDVTKITRHKNFQNSALKVRKKGELNAAVAA